MNAPVLVALDASDYDPLEIAKKELAQKKIPLIIRRFLPDGSYEDWKSVSPHGYKGHPLFLLIPPLLFFFPQSARVVDRRLEKENPSVYALSFELQLKANHLFSLQLRLPRRRRPKKPHRFPPSHLFIL